MEGLGLPELIITLTTIVMLGIAHKLPEWLRNSMRETRDIRQKTQDKRMGV